MSIARMPMPRRVAALPRHRGMPVPAAAIVDGTGKPDFRVIDLDRWWELASEQRCGVCGTRLGASIWFVGGPLSIANRLFTDQPMHKDCARYALVVCPFLALPSFRYADPERLHLQNVSLSTNLNVSPERPQRFGLGRTTGYTVVLLGNSPGLQAEPFVQLEWWQHGRKLETT